MRLTYKDAAIKKITAMPEEKVYKVLTFMAGLEAEHYDKKQERKLIRKAVKRNQAK